MYEVNADNNRSFSSGDAAKVASVAVAWRKQGHSPKAYAICVRGGKIVSAEVLITTVLATTAALRGTNFEGRVLARNVEAERTDTGFVKTDR